MKLIINKIKEFYPEIESRLKIVKLNQSVKCAYSGIEITSGVKIEDIFKPNFTDTENFKFLKSGYLGVDIALSFSNIKGKAGLRNYSIYADAKELKFVKYSDFLDLIMAIPRIPFNIAFSFSGKKHVTYKCTEQNNRDYFTIQTDRGVAYFNRKSVNEFFPIIKKWYSISNNKPFFTQAQIGGRQEIATTQILKYGKETFYMEDRILEKFRKQLIFEIFTTKTLKNEKND